RSGETVTVKAALTDKTDRAIANQKLKPVLAFEQVEAAGFQASLAKKDLVLRDGAKATAMILKGKQGEEAWIGFSNFYVITRYNHSKLYAMAVFQLSESIK
ncbi:MAG: membrane-bound lytic murein transglycosylase B, partial [Pseudohongiellaceae bacterium]